MSRFNLRQRPRISYCEPVEPNLDEYVFCEQCADYVYEYCSIHGPLLVVPDDKVPAKPNVPSFVPRAALTIPRVFLHIAPSVIPGAGLGVFTTLTLPCGVRFGPYKGEKTTEINSMYCWQIYDSNNKPSHVVDAANANKSNWMRYVNCARHWCEQNLVAFQYQGHLYYRTIKIIPRFTELMVFYGSEFANSLRVDLRKYNAPPEYAQKFGAPIKKSKFDSRKENISIKASNEDTFKTVNSVENIATENKNIPELCKNTEYLEQAEDKINCIKTAVGDKNNNLIDTSKNKFICNECGQGFDKKDSIILHIKTKHLKDVYFRCTKCAYYAVTKARLEKHLNFHDENRQYVCDLCHYRFNTKVSLKQHKKGCDIKNNVSNTHSTVKSYSCIECCKKFTNKHQLVTHIRTHTGEKPHSCTVCNKQFNHSSSLNKHTRIHTGEKPYSCTVCNKQFNQSGPLNSHIRTHTGEKPYSCTVCNKQFNQSGHLNKHMRTHTGEKPYSCTVCNKLFNQSCNLNTHMRTHTGEKPYSCTVCKKRFSVKSNWRRHSKTCQ